MSDGWVYPATLAAWWLAEAEQATGLRGDEALERLEPVVGRLSDGFTVGRPERFEDYAVDSLARAAYGLFFLPQTFVRCVRVLEELALTGWRPPEAGMRLLDVGCGLGAATLAARQVWSEAAFDVVALDHSAASLEALRRMVGAGVPIGGPLALKAIVGDAGRNLPVGSFDLILVSFALNEFFPPPDTDRSAAFLRRLHGLLAPSGALVVVEPAGEAPSLRLRLLRDVFAVEPRAVLLGPCPHVRGCPMAGAGCGFCHDVRPWRPPATLERLNRRLQRSVQDLKHSLLIVGAAGARPPAWQGDSDVFRLVSPVSRTKGRLVARGCFGDGALRGIEIPTRHMTRVQEDEVMALARGTLLRGVDPRALDGGRIVRLEAVRVIMAPAAEAVVPVFSFSCPG